MSRQAVSRPGEPERRVRELTDTLPEFGISEEAMNSLRSFQPDLWSARALQLAVALCVSLIAACGGGGYGGGGGGMGGMSSSAPMITAQPMSQSVTAPAAATFSVTATSPA